MTTNIQTSFRSDVEPILPEETAGAEAPRVAPLSHAVVDAIQPGTLPEAILPTSPALLLPWSGLYGRARPGQPLLAGDELRLDVDGGLPQMAASGIRRSALAQQLHWVAENLTPVGANIWQGSIPHAMKDGHHALLPHDTVRIRTWRTGLLGDQKAEVTFSGGGHRAITHVYDFRSRYFDRVEFEFDATADANPVYTIDTGAHPNRPANLPLEQLSIATVYRRAGFDARISGAPNIVPLTGAGIDAVWSDTEMHDAMQANWSRFANKPQWALWVFSAALHEDTVDYQGYDLGGIMFDFYPAMRPHRQGTAIFTESFIREAPPNDPAVAAYVARTRFWTTVHEMGHAFNLAHSWQKNWGTSWKSLQNEPEARSFMNYPRRVTGGQAAFYASFDYRFSDEELLFLRHAPRRFVQMGNADWFDHHGFQNAAISAQPSLLLELRVNRPNAALEFLEPAMVELKVKNVSGEPMVVDKYLLADEHELTVVVKRDGQPARLWRPFAKRCLRSAKAMLEAGQSLYQSLFAATGPDGWLVAEPGWYTLQACLHLDTGEDVVSAPLRLKVLPPRGREDEVLAQDLFTEPVGRVLAFDGTREPSLDGAKDVLRETTEKFRDHSVATHAAVALAMPLRRPGKVLVGAGNRLEKIEEIPAKPEEARGLLESALLPNREMAAQTLGHIEYREYTQTLARTLADLNEFAAARKVAKDLETTLAIRGVKPRILNEIRSFAAALAGAPGATEAGAGTTTK
jgi:hypothetical protein